MAPSQQLGRRRLVLLLAGLGCVALLWSSSRCPGCVCDGSSRYSASSTSSSSSSVGSSVGGSRSGNATAVRLGGGGTEPGADGAGALGPPPYRFPRLIHQTVVNKSRLSCEEKAAIDSWKRVNPGYVHRLWDDADIREFMLQHYPELVPVPFDEFLSGTERSDLWRVLVLHKLGGVYADVDVQCLQPIDTWNARHGHDAALLLGLENYDAGRAPHRLHVLNWAAAAAPGHPLLGRVPGVVARAIARQYFAAARAARDGGGGNGGSNSGRGVDPKAYEAGILDRTGPAALTEALYDHFASLGIDLNSKSEGDVNSRAGLAAGGVRVLPVRALAAGWEVAAARQHGKPRSCADVAAGDATALVCHMFWGSWRSDWHYAQRFTYEGC